MKTKYKQKDIFCGESYITTTVYPEYTPPKGSRKRKTRPTSEAQQHYNDVRRKNYVSNLVNTNYEQGDYWATITYNDEHLPADFNAAIRDRKNFIERLRYFCKVSGLPMPRVIAVTGYGARRKRLHHHIIISGFVPIGEFIERWKDKTGNWLGWVDVKPLQFDKIGVECLAKYFIKHIEENKQRGIKTPYYRSRNLSEPIEKTKNAKISHRQIEFAKSFTDISIFERLHPEYQIADYTPIYNDCNGGYYFTIKYYKPPKKRKGKAIKKYEVSRRQKPHRKRHRKNN